MIYAFKKGDKSQTLEEHIDECLKALSEIKKTKLWLDEFDEVFVERVIVFHDIGKVVYQKDSDELSFPGHEFVSAYVFWKVFEEEFINVYEKRVQEQELLYLFPIIFHHHAMKMKNRLEKLKKIQIRINDEVLHELAEILENYADKRCVLNVVDVLKNLDMNAAAEKVKDIISEIWHAFHGSFAKKALRLLLIAVICDYEGSKNRSTHTVFGSVVEDFLKVLICARTHCSDIIADTQA